MPKDLWCSRAVGSWSAPLLGSTAAEDLPRIGRTSIARRSHSCASLQSASCSENFVIRLDVPGQTLSDLDLSFADFEGANLSGAKLCRAELFGARLHGADLSNVDLTDARIGGANLDSTD